MQTTAPAAPATGYSAEQQFAALLRRARIGLAFAAECENDAGFQFWNGYAAAISDALSDLPRLMAARDAHLAQQPQTRHEAAGAALPECTKNLTLPQVRQILAAKGFQVATDAVAHADVGAGEVFKDNVVAGVDGDDEHAALQVHVGDGSGAHGHSSEVDEAAIVAQQGGAA